MIKATPEIHDSHHTFYSKVKSFPKESRRSGGDWPGHYALQISKTVWLKKYCEFGKGINESECGCS